MLTMLSTCVSLGNTYIYILSQMTFNILLREPYESFVQFYSRRMRYRREKNVQICGKKAGKKKTTVKI
jgi:hypothetical protein